MLIGRTQRDLNWEEKRRRALERRNVPAPPRVTPLTRAISASALRNIKQSRDMLENHAASPARANGNGSAQENKGEASIQQGSSPPLVTPSSLPNGHHSSETIEKDPSFEKMVEAEMRKLEAEFESHMTLDNGSASSRKIDFTTTSGSPVAAAERGYPSPSPAPAYAAGMNHHPGPLLSPSPGLLQLPGTTGSSGTTKMTPPSRGFGRGISTLCGDGQSNGQPLPVAAGALPPSSARSNSSSSRPTGFGKGKGISSLYESPDEDQHKRRDQQEEYAKALNQQMEYHSNEGGSATRRKRTSLSEGFYTGLPIGGTQGGGEGQGGSSYRSPPRRHYPGLEHMFDDPEATRHRMMDQREYSRALDEQLLEKRKQQEKEGLLTSPLDGESPSRRQQQAWRSSMDGPVPTNGALVSPLRALPNSIYIPERETRQKSSEKKAAYAAALKQQIMEKEEKRKREKEEAIRNEELQELMMARSNGGGVTTMTMSPIHPYLFNNVSFPEAENHHQITIPGSNNNSHLYQSPAAASAPARTMTEARRRLVRDVYGSNTSPWSTSRRLSPSPPRIPHPAPRDTAPGSLPPAGGPPVSEQHQQYSSPADPLNMSMSTSSALKPSFARHGALAYDPFLQDTLGQRQQQALEQRFALEQQMEEKKRTKMEKDAQRKAEEEMEMRKMEEEYRRVKEEKELEKRRREAVEAEAKEQALAEAQRRKEANERAAALARQQEVDEADSAESRQRPHRRAASDVPPRRQEENDDLLWEAAASPQRSHPSIFSQGGRRHHPRGGLTADALDSLHNGLEQGLSTDSKFIAIDDGTRPAGERYGSQPRKPYYQARGGHASPSYRSPNGAAGGGDEMDAFVDSWQRDRGRAGGGSNSGPGKGRAHTRLDDSLASESTLMFLSEEEKQRAESEYWQQRGAHKRASSEGAAMGMSSTSSPVRQRGQATPMSPLAELLENHREIQPDRQVLEELHQETSELMNANEGEGLDTSLDLGSLEGLIGGADVEGGGVEGGDYADESFEADIGGDDHDEGGGIGVSQEVGDILRNISRELNAAAEGGGSNGGSLSGSAAAVIPQEGGGGEGPHPASAPNSGRKKWHRPISEEERKRVIDDIVSKDV